MTTLKLNSKGDEVKTLQHKLNDFGNYGLVADGIFGAKTQTAVKDFQKKKGLVVDGIVGAKTWAALGITSNCPSNPPITNNKPSTSGIIIEDHFLDKKEYLNGKYEVDYLVLHHTAGWDSPYQTIDIWNRDSQGRVGTEFVVGGQRSTDGRKDYDGKILRAYPEGNMAYHIGSSGSSYMTTHSCGIEICNMGYVKNGKTYQNSLIIPSQTYKLSKPFRGYTEWHRYSDAQIESVRKLILYIANRDNIDLHKGVYEWIKKEGAAGFDYHSDAYYGKVKKGMITHANIRKDKVDLHPQPEMLDMIASL